MPSSRCLGVDHSEEVLCNVGGQEPEGGDPFHTVPVDVKCIRVSSLPAEVYYYFLCFGGV